MQGNKHMKTIRNIIYVAFALLLASFGLLPQMQAVVPAPDGGYPGQNTAEGQNALFSLTTGTSNTATGFQALYSNIDGRENTATGNSALYRNTTGVFNTAIGSSALLNNTFGNGNTATGAFALAFNTTGYQNTATGISTLANNTTGGNNNTATGAYALEENTTGNNNTADGLNALVSNTTGAQNTATGTGALKNNTTANNNTADGFQVLFHNTTGANNTAVGQHALFNNTGSSNIALGSNAGGNLTMGSHNIDIGNAGVNSESNTIRIGTAQTRTFIKDISGVVVAGASVVVNAGGQLGVTASSTRFKDKIKPMDKASEAILALKPVTFRYKQELDPDGIRQFGLVAEEVEKINPDLVARDADGKPYTVRYEAVNAMLLNEFLKEHRKVQELEANDGEQQREIKALIATVKEQAAQVQKVSAQLEASKPAPQVVNNP
jgi:hypothetical protein